MILGCTAVHADPDIASMYDVSTEGTSTTVKAGEKGKVVISIHAKNGAHVSDEAPLRIELSSKESSSTKRRSRSLTRSTKRERRERVPRRTIRSGFHAEHAGKTTVDARMTFFICTESLCSRQTKKMSLPVEVN